MPTPSQTTIMQSVSLANRARDAYSVVHEWHRDVGHVGSFRLCTEQPCHAIHRARLA